MLRVELVRAFRRWRTYVFAVGLAGIPILMVVSLKLSSTPPPPGPDAPLFLSQILANGLFAPLTAIALIQPFFLPLGAGLLSGDSIAGEASAGTLRYLLVRPVGRARLVLAKFGFVMLEVTAGVVWVIVVGLVAGGITYGLGPLPSLSGTTLGTAEALLRILATAGYVIVGVAPVAVAIVSQVLDHVSSVRVIHPYLISHRWLAFVDLFRSPVEWGDILRGLLTFAVYIAIFLGAALAVFTRKDVTS